MLLKFQILRKKAHSKFSWTRLWQRFQRKKCCNHWTKKNFLLVYKITVRDLQSWIMFIKHSRKIRNRSLASMVCRTRMPLSTAIDLVRRRYPWANSTTKAILKILSSPVNNNHTKVQRHLLKTALDEVLVDHKAIDYLQFKISQNFCKTKDLKWMVISLLVSNL